MPYVSVKEIGSRPIIMTPARINAPQGAKVLADMLHDSGLVDMALVTLDWEGDFFWDTENNGPMPKELRKPVMFIYAAKYYQQVDKVAYIEMPIDVEDAFAQSNFSNDVALEIIDHIRLEFEQKLYESYHMKGAN